MSDQDNIDDIVETLEQFFRDGRPLIEGGSAIAGQHPEATFRQVFAAMRHVAEKHGREDLVESTNQKEDVIRQMGRLDHTFSHYVTSGGLH